MRLSFASRLNIRVYLVRVLCKHLAFRFFQIMTCILTEQRIVLFSSDWALLTLIAECFMLYLHPLQWQHTFVPILSRQMLDFVMAPTSFLMGCHTDHFEEVSTVSFRHFHLSVHLSP